MFDAETARTEVNDLAYFRRIELYVSGPADSPSSTPYRLSFMSVSLGLSML